jgi:hypothetical protein
VKGNQVARTARGEGWVASFSHDEGAARLWDVSTGVSIRRIAIEDSSVDVAVPARWPRSRGGGAVMNADTGIRGPYEMGSGSNGSVAPGEW